MATMVLDIGGTAIKSGLFDGETLSDIQETPTEARLGGAHVVQRSKDIIASYRERCSFDRIGISTAGQVDPVSGQIIYANENIPGYTGTRLGEIIAQTFHVPTAVENDVNAAAIGESVFGAGKDRREFVCLTYGTGVGGAIFSGGRLYSGCSYSAGEFGAIVTHPEDRDIGSDMFSGCYEKYASATALVKSAVQTDPTLDSGRKIFERIDEPEVRALVDRWTMEIVYGLITIVHMLNPECVILGGGIMEQPCVLEQLREKLYPNIMPSFRHVQIKRAALGNRAGMLGAAVL
ncbi:MAG: ROK family protein [Lachnospiraceae bacterium]|jgi:glucokinase|nr:ROK family protein [Lachnospiraceae bacterium]MDE6918318.1 ROK family protein [Lachnospiraceae bacterium]